jgi:hypothetical protein
MKKEILSLIEHYATTGNIGQPLVRYYNQHGRWQGNTLPWQLKMPKHLELLMEKSRLPADRRVSYGPNGEILHTSYTSRSKVAVRIPYIKIHGSLTIDTDVPISAPHLQHVACHLVSSSSAQIDLPNLESIDGDCILIHSDDLNAPSLKKVGGNLLISGNLPPALITVEGRLGLYGTQPYNAPNLKIIGESFIVLRAKNHITPFLKNIGGDFLFGGFTSKINAPRLTNIGGDFLAFNAKDIEMFGLRNVGGNINTSKANHYYHPDIKLGGTWTIAPDALENWVRRKRALEWLRSRETPQLEWDL